MNYRYCEVLFPKANVIVLSLKAQSPNHDEKDFRPHWRVKGQGKASSRVETTVLPSK